jgi:L-methionine (R)-S-oxide reductase
MLEQMYHQLGHDLKSLIGEDPKFPHRAALVSLISLLKENHPKISWVGVYLRNDDQSEELYIGPYQGKTACVLIPPGKGVCGAAFRQNKTLIVPDVEDFPGHIACDSLSRSEIVVPLYHRSRLIGVLDLDSHELNAFTTVDQMALESLLKRIEQLP